MGIVLSKRWSVFISFSEALSRGTTRAIIDPSRVELHSAFVAPPRLSDVLPASQRRPLLTVISL
jgi:hypothetical protein